MEKTSARGLLTKTSETQVCVQCHSEVRAEMLKASHHPIREGRMECSSCHNPHASTEALLVKNTVNDTGATCHAGKRGPFLWEHAPVRENDIPHNFSNRAQTPYIRRSPGLFEVPAHVPIAFKRLATAAADAPGVLASDDQIAAYQNTFLHATPLDIETTVSRFSFDFGAWEALSVGAAYDRRGQFGQKGTYGPIGDRPPRTLNIQLTEPIDSLTQELTVSAERVTGNYALQFNYLFSDFANRIDTLVWENIYTTAAPDATYDTWDRAVSTYGRRPLQPDNRYHNVSVTVGRDLALDSRLNATLAYGRLEQNQTLLPYSYHEDLLVISTLPRGTAMASIDTLQLLFDYAVNPVPRLNLRA